MICSMTRRHYAYILGRGYKYVYLIQVTLVFQIA